MDRSTLFSIGEFAQAAGISTKALRYYEKKGILKPYWIEQDTGYRYYSLYQLNQLNLIGIFIDLDICLNQFSNYIDHNYSSIDYQKLLQFGKELTQERIQILEDKMRYINYLKEKAESFSDTIISNTPNVIIVMNEALEVQQVNEAAVHFLGLKQASDIVGEPIVRILNPAEYMNVMLTGKNVYEKPYYLAEYERYVEETIIYDKAYKIIITLMRDVTEETKANEEKTRSRQQTAEIADKVIEKQMRVVQEIASLLGETTAETKIALTELKESLQ